MQRTVTILIAALVVVGTVAAVPAAAGAVPGVGDQQVEQRDTNETDANASVAPGERLAGVLGVQEAELDGEVESRSFGLAVARAASNESRAALVAAEVNETGAELDQLEERKAELDRARENGSMSDGQYRAEVAELSARADNVERMANESANASEGLPADLLESHGVNASAIETLRSGASELGGQEVAEIARSIAGEAPDTAADRGGDAPDETTAPADVTTDAGGADVSGTDDGTVATTASGNETNTAGPTAGQQTGTAGAGTGGR